MASMYIGEREQYVRLAHDWVSLWCPPTDWGLFDRLHADDFVDCSPDGRGTSKDDFRRGLEDFAAMFPDAMARVDGLVIDEAMLMMTIRWSASATDRRAGGTEAIAVRVLMTGIEIVEIEDGRIIRRWGEWNLSSGIHQH